MHAVKEHLLNSFAYLDAIITKQVRILQMIFLCLLSIDKRSIFFFKVCGIIGIQQKAYLTDKESHVLSVTTL